MPIDYTHIVLLIRSNHVRDNLSLMPVAFNAPQDNRSSGLIAFEAAGFFDFHQRDQTTLAASFTIYIYSRH